MASLRCRCRAPPVGTLHLSRPCTYHRYTVVSDGDAETASLCASTGGVIGTGSTAMKIADAFPTLLQSFFIDRLMRQRQVSPHTLASYRDTFRLLVQYAQRRLRKAPSDLTMPDLDPSLIGAFLDHLEKE